MANNQNFTSMLITAIRDALKLEAAAHPDDVITLDQIQANHTMGHHQARLRLKGDDGRVYRMIICPEDAPVFLGDGKTPADQFFADPLGRAE